MSSYSLGQVLKFSEGEGHPDSKIVGIDSYKFQSNDGKMREWKSYTLVPIHEDEQKDIYTRWYIVDLPLLGMSFVRIIDVNEFPKNLKEELQLTGKAQIKTEGSSELGTGVSEIWTYWDNTVSPPQMYAKERFEDNSTLYFKTDALFKPATIIN